MHRFHCTIFAMCSTWGLIACGDAAEDAPMPAVSTAQGLDDVCPPAPLPAAACPVPWLPRTLRLHTGASWVFPAQPDGTIEIGYSSDTAAAEPGAWRASDRFEIDGEGPTKVFARLTGLSDCAPATASWVYQGVSAYAPAAGGLESTAISSDDGEFVGWATAVSGVVFGEEVDDAFRDPAQALGPPEATPFSVLVLGEGGTVTLTFADPIADGPGPDFAVFENSFGAGIIELAYVEISSDATHFLRFPSAYLGHDPIGPFGTYNAELVTGMAGKYRAGFGSPFDLRQFSFHPDVWAGLVDLTAITHVRLLDIVGDGRATDSYGNPIYDPYPARGSAGFDLDAIGVLNSAGSTACAHLR